LCASGSVFARRLSTPIHELFAIVACPTRLAVTCVIAISRRRVRTGSAVFAWILVAALRPWHLAVGSSEAIGADARVIVDSINASASVHAGGRRAIFIVDLAIRPGEPTLTITSVGIDIVMTRCLVLTRIGGAFVHVDLTFVAIEAVNAKAFESIRLIQTRTTIQTRLLGTVINVDETVTAFETVAAFAFICAIFVDTLASVTARCRHGTFVNVLVTEATSKA